MKKILFLLTGGMFFLFSVTQIDSNGCVPDSIGAVPDSINVFYGNACDGVLPAFPPPPQPSCSTNTVQFNFNRHPSDLLILPDQLSPNPYPVFANLCDTLEYNLVLKSSELGAVVNPDFLVALPTGITFQDVTFTYPYGIGTPVTLSTFDFPSGWNLSTYFSSLNSPGLTGTGTSPNNQVGIKLHLTTDCTYLPNGGSVTFSAMDTSSCSTILTDTLTPPPPPLNGFSPPDNLSYSINVSNPVFCNDTSAITITVTNTGSSATNHNNVLTVTTPPVNPLQISNTVPPVTPIGNQIIWTLPSISPSGGQAIFSFDLSINPPFTTYCPGPSAITAFINYSETIPCSTGPACTNSYPYPTIIPDTVNICCNCNASSLSVSISSQTNVSCNAGNNGSATATPSGGILPYTYLWTPSGGNAATANNLFAGNYIITVTDAMGCTDTANVTITEPANALTIPTITQTNVSCFAGNNGSATANPTGGTPPYTYLWSNGNTPQTANNLIAGTYNVTVTDANGCTAIATVTITQPAKLIINLTQIDVLCYGGNNGSATANPSGGTTPYTYLWSNGDLNQTAYNLTAGTYQVTVTDANGCSAITTVTITQPANALTISTTQTNVSCPSANNGSATANPSGGTPPYIYLWSNGDPTPTANNLVAGFYIVTVTDANGCTITAAVIINVIPITASFTYLPNPPCYNLNNNNAPVNFTYSGTGATSWAWTFGDNNSSPQQNPSHAYNSPGPFWVTLTVTDASGVCTATSSQQINIAPNCFATLITYNYNGPTVIDNSTGNYSFSQNYTVNQTINVTAPFILTVPSGITIEFGPQGKIIVENNPATGNGARLIMQPGSKLTSITNSTAPSCPVMWPGVEVWGNSDTASLNSLGQGKVTMNPGATIENAHIGVLLGKKSTCIPGPLVRCAFYDIGNSGGIIDANGAVFNRNAISIRFFPYANTNSSKIQACTFNGGSQVLDSGYVDGNSYTYPTSADPYYAPSNQLGVSFWHVYLWGIKDVQFFDNTFNTVWSEAILAIDSRFNVKKLNPLGNGNWFRKLQPGIPYFFGIHIINTVSSPSYYHEIRGNTFNPCPFIGIGIGGNNGSDLIQRNFFDAQINFTNSGIYLANSSGFNINDNNQFNVFPYYCIAVLNSGTGGGNIGFPGGNTFTNCSYNSAIVAWGFGSPPPGNPFLQIKCNNFNNSLSLYYQANPSHNPILSNNIITDNAIPNQGSYPANQSEDKKPAGNEFFPVIFNRNQIYSFSPYIYYRHHLDAQGGLKILPDPNSLITVIENPGVNKTLTSCDPDPCSICSPNCCRLAQLNTQAAQLQTLKQEYNTLFANLDKGQTVQLIAAINHNKPTPPGQLKNMLLAASPLSNAVLFSFINRTVAQTPPGIFKDVMFPNLPVSDTVLVNALLPKLSTLPPDIANQIRTLQGNNPAYRTLTSILRDINSVETQRAQGAQRGNRILCGERFIS